MNMGDEKLHKCECNKVAVGNVGKDPGELKSLTLISLGRWMNFWKAFVGWLGMEVLGKPGISWNFE